MELNEAIRRARDPELPADAPARGRTRRPIYEMPDADDAEKWTGSDEGNPGNPADLPPPEPFCDPIESYGAEEAGPGRREGCERCH